MHLVAFDKSQKRDQQLRNMLPKPMSKSPDNFCWHHKIKDGLAKKPLMELLGSFQQRNPGFQSAILNVWQGNKEK